MWYSLIRIPLLFLVIVMDYKKMYRAEKRRVDAFQERLQKEQEKNDNYYAYILKQNVIIQLLKDNIKELKGLK